MAGVLLLWLGAVLSDRYQRWTGEPRRLSLHEEPLEFAHNAVIFAGKPWLPGRAILYDLGQTGLYDFYHAPERKSFMDGRLEMPALETFQTYVNIEKWLEERDPRWHKALKDLGDPVVVLTHLQHFGGEAALLNSPDWTCAYFDAMAAVFAPRASGTGVDFARRHFEQPKAPSIPSVRGAAFRELRSLYNLGIASRSDPNTAWTWRLPLLLHALDRAAVAIREEPNRAGNWVLLGNCHRAIAEILSMEDTAASRDRLSLLRLARARYAYEQALRIDPRDATAQRSQKELDAVYLRLREHLSGRNLPSSSSPAPAKNAAERIDTELVGKADPDCRRGIGHLVQYRLGEARQAFGRAAEMSPQDGISLYFLAWLAAEEGDGLATLQACRHALERELPPGRQRELKELQKLVTNAISTRSSQADARERG
jgi:tetratricopeptide (TPR) repeat protein